MVLGNVGDNLHLVGGEIFQSAVQDQVHAVFMVTGVTDVPADVVQKRAVFDQLALGGRQAMQDTEFVE